MPKNEPLTASRRSLNARIAALTRWSTEDPVVGTEKARANNPSQLEWHRKRVDPDGILPPAERERRAEVSRRLYFAQLARKSADARRKRPA